MIYYIDILGRQHFVYANNRYEAVRKVARQYTALIPRWWIPVKVGFHGLLLPYTLHIKQDHRIIIKEEEEEQQRRRARLKKKRRYY